MQEMDTGVAPEARSEVYPSIEASKLAGSLKDKVAFVTGAGMHSNSL